MTASIHLWHARKTIEMTAYKYRAQNDRGDTVVDIDGSYLHVTTDEGNALRLPLGEVERVELSVMDAPMRLRLYTLSVYAMGDRKPFPRITNTAILSAQEAGARDEGVMRGGFRLQDGAFREFVLAFHRAIAGAAPHAHFVGHEVDMKLLMRAVITCGWIGLVTLFSAWFIFSQFDSVPLALVNIGAGVFAGYAVWRRIIGERRAVYDPRHIPPSYLPAANDR